MKNQMENSLPFKKKKIKALTGRAWPGQNEREKELLSLSSPLTTARASPVRHARPQGSSDGSSQPSSPLCLLSLPRSSLSLSPSLSLSHQSHNQIESTGKGGLNGYTRPWWGVRKARLARAQLNSRWNAAVTPEHRCHSSWWWNGGLRPLLIVALRSNKFISISSSQWYPWFAMKMVGFQNRLFVRDCQNFDCGSKPNEALSSGKSLKLLIVVKNNF